MIDCARCGKSFEPSESLKKRIKEKRDPGRCPQCRYQLDLERMKKAMTKSTNVWCAVRRTIPQQEVRKMFIRPLPDNGVPWIDKNHYTRWYVRYLVGTDPTKLKTSDERRAYMVAETEEEAVSEARQWIIRAVMQGATNLSRTFVAKGKPTAPMVRAMSMLRNLNRDRKKEVTINRRLLYDILVDGEVVDTKDVWQDAEAQAAVLRRKLAPRILPEDPDNPFPCALCGRKPVWKDRNILQHAEFDCPNVVVLKVAPWPRTVRVMLWNRVFSKGELRGLGVVNKQHIRGAAQEMVDIAMGRHVPMFRKKKKAADPLEGFEV